MSDHPAAATLPPGALRRRPVFVSRESAETRTGRLESLAGLAAVLAGLTGLTVISVAAILVMMEVETATQAVAAIATSAGGVIGTVVGAYFGVRLGDVRAERADARTREADLARLAGEIRVEELTAHLEPAAARTALDSADQRAERLAAC